MGQGDEEEPVVNMTKELCEDFGLTSQATAGWRGFVKHCSDNIRFLVDKAVCSENS
jgi:hypothetical protein